MYHRNPRNDGKLIDKHQLTSENVMLHAYIEIFRRRKRPWPNFEYYPEISERNWNKLRRTPVRMVGSPTQIPNDCLPNSLPFQPTCLLTEHHINDAEFWVLSAVLLMVKRCLDVPAWLLANNCRYFGGTCYLRLYSLILIYCKSDVWLTVHRNSVWIRKTN